jgi:hypothetical protein
MAKRNVPHKLNILLAALASVLHVHAGLQLRDVGDPGCGSCPCMWVHVGDPGAVGYAHACASMWVTPAVGMPIHAGLQCG